MTEIGSPLPEGHALHVSQHNSDQATGSNPATPSTQLTCDSELSKVLFRDVLEIPPEHTPHLSAMTGDTEMAWFCKCSFFSIYLKLKEAF